MEAAFGWKGRGVSRLLRELAEKATPGPWDAFSGERFGDVLSDPDGDGARFVICEQSGSDAPYIAACDPQTILALLDRLDRYEAALRKYAVGDPSSPAAKALNPPEQP